MTDLLNANIRKNEHLDPYNPFDNPMENPKYNMDYSEMFSEIDEKKKPALVPDAKEGRKIRKYYNIVGVVLLIFAFISNLLPVLALKGVYEAVKYSDTAAGIDTSAYSYYYNVMHHFTDDSSVSIAIVLIIHVIFNVLTAFIGLKLIKVKPIELFAEPVRLKRRDVLKYVFTALGIQIILMYSMSALTGFLASKDIDITRESLCASTNVKAVILNIIYCCIVAPITEEFLFRGFAMKALSRVSQRFGIFMSAFLFGLAHGNIVQMVSGFIIGILMGYVDVKHNSLIPSIIIHFAVNIFSCIMMYTNMMSGSAGHFVQYFVSGITIVLLFVGIVSFLFTLRTDRIPYNTPEQSMRSSGMVIKSLGLVLLIAADIAFMVLGYVLK